MTPTNSTSDTPTTQSIGENPPVAGRRSRPAPPWDGLSDEKGPIPTFGPAITDENGRLVIDEEESKARSDAIQRMLSVIRNITDESDTDEVWDEVTRALEESHSTDRNLGPEASSRFRVSIL
jgi:hypothetical protein